MSDGRKKVSISTPCFNEEENVAELYQRVKDIFNSMPQYDYEHLFIDNASTDNTIKILKAIAQKDKNVKLIVNSRNFGQVRSPYYAIMQTTGDVVITLSADFQDPPEMIGKFLAKWEQGYKIAVGVKKGARESKLMTMVRKTFYNLINAISEIDLLKDFTGFGMFDREVVEIFRKIDDPYPYLRGLICDVGYNLAVVEYVQPSRRKGRTKNNFYSLYDVAMLGITNHSKLPLRLATMLGFSVAASSFFLALVYFIYKLVMWQTFTVGTAPVVIGLFFFSAVQLFFIGVIGEYIGAIHTQVLKRPLVIEKERVNF